MPDQLEVHLYGEHVADVIDAGQGQCALRYTDRALAVGAPARLSLALPIRREVYPATAGAMRWLRGLLPEGPALQWAAEEYRVPVDDVFGLLAALGRDVAGAAVLVPEGEPLADPHARYEPLGDEELAGLVSRAHDRPLGLDRERGVRLSLPGVQDKLLLHKPTRSRRYYLPTYGEPSTLIVKPEPDDREGRSYRGLATNEALCLALARTAGLQSAAAQVERFGDRVALVVRRYDRIYRSGGEVERVHQEDLLAALGLDPFLKYEAADERHVSPTGPFQTLGNVSRRSGPGLDDFARLLDTHLGRAGVLRLLEIVTFNVLIGNADAHARNLSLQLQRDGSVELAPLYDLLCTRLYPWLERQPAQLVNAVGDIDEISAADLVAHGSSWDLPASLARSRVETVIRTALDGLSGTVQEVVSAGASDDAAGRVAELIGARAVALLGDPT